ncbi:MAG: DUF4037 domain-containing protein [Acutalibacteraceae bacterium]|nr:DUF4037 domain-containing protein [Acutalibacteraceae bacterium]
MQGLDISREFYLQYGEPMLESEFCDVADRIAVGLVGEGSECLGFDDEVSRDHDFDAGFCLFITKEDEEKFGFKLERAYSKLPKEFMGLKRGLISPVGGNRHGVIVIDDFYTRFLGAPNAPDTVERWLYTPSFSLLCASNGEVFEDKLGAFSKVRNELLKGYPEDIRRKKLAAHTVLMAQAGQYNYPRLISRDEQGAAQLAIFEFVKNAISAIYLLNNKYEPFYKWAYRGLKNLEILGDISDALQGLTELDNSPENAQTKSEVIEDIAALFIEQFTMMNLTKAVCGDLEKHAYSILDGIKDANLRNMHIMSA